jgi:ketosteroid isomerase-like protein
MHMTVFTSEDAVRRRIAEIAHAADDGRTDDYIVMFTTDAIWEVPSGRYSGREEIRRVLETIAPTAPQRHLVLNTVFEDASDVDRAVTISDFVFMVYDQIGWTIAAAGRYHDTFRIEDGEWRLHRRSVRGQTPSEYMPRPVDV